MSEAIEKVIEEEIAAVKEDSIKTVFRNYCLQNPSIDFDSAVKIVSSLFDVDGKTVEQLCR